MIDDATKAEMERTRIAWATEKAEQMGRTKDYPNVEKMGAFAWPDAFLAGMEWERGRQGTQISVAEAVIDKRGMALETLYPLVDDQCKMVIAEALR